MIFDDLRISSDKTPEEQLKQIKSWADNLIDSLQMLNDQVDEIENQLNEKSRKG